jgi:2-polyprenyl-3-methyl-5-hydroxy-6-metoxy-1,4-benzoquinol methylase
LAASAGESILSSDDFTNVMQKLHLAADPSSVDSRFQFGDNWRSFLDRLDDDRVTEAEKSLKWLLHCERLDGIRFLDIGSGSGLSSLAARRLGARVVSFDYDPQSVECTAILRDRVFPADRDWQIERGSILDRDYLKKLGEFDVVYSWGVLHHTGAMRDAIKNAAQLVAPGGTLALALYRKTALCWFWALEKRWYCRTSEAAQAFARAIYVGMMRAAFVLRRRDFASYVSHYSGNRGMDFTHDVHDWLGGYPYESIRPAEVDRLLSQLGFQQVRAKLRRGSLGLFGSGCNEYVYQRIAD